MKSQLIIQARIPTGARRINAIAAAVNKSGLELERDVKENIAASVPGGRVYRRSAIVARPSRRNNGLGLRRRGRNLIVGYNFHRASRRGQPPAIFSGRLINSIRSGRVGPLAARVWVGAFYGLILDDPAGLDRPFFHSRALLYHPRFTEKIRIAAQG
jgi:hypothetical protein